MRTKAKQTCFACVLIIIVILSIYGEYHKLEYVVIDEDDIYPFHYSPEDSFVQHFLKRTYLQNDNNCKDIERFPVYFYALSDEYYGNHPKYLQNFSKFGSFYSSDVVNMNLVNVTLDANEACLFVPPFTLYNINEARPPCLQQWESNIINMVIDLLDFKGDLDRSHKRFMHCVNNLKYWNKGKNHIVYTDSDDCSLKFENAINVAAQGSYSNFVLGRDIAIPLFHDNESFFYDTMINNIDKRQRENESVIVNQSSVSFEQNNETMNTINNNNNNNVDNQSKNIKRSSPTTTTSANGANEVKVKEIIPFNRRPLFGTFIGQTYSRIFSRHFIFVLDPQQMDRRYGEYYQILHPYNSNQDFNNSLANNSNIRPLRFNYSEEEMSNMIANNQSYPPPIDVIVRTMCHHHDFIYELLPEMENYCKCREGVKTQVAYKFRYEELMRHSKFCFAPRGAGHSSYRIIESLKYGCIPVIFGDENVLPFTGIIDWHSFAIIVPEHQMIAVTNVLRVMTKMSEKKLMNMQKVGQIMLSNVFYNQTTHIHSIIATIRQNIIDGPYSVPLKDPLIEAFHSHLSNLIRNIHNISPLLKTPQLTTKTDNGEDEKENEEKVSMRPHPHQHPHQSKKPLKQNVG